MAKNVLRAELELKNRRAIQSAKQATGEVRKFGKEGVRSTDRVAGASDKLKTAIMGMVGAYAGFAGARIIMQQLREETERIDKATRSALEAMRSVLALSALKGRRAEEVQAIQAMSVYAGRPLEEVSKAYYSLLGGTYGMTPERQKGLMQQALLFQKTDPTAQLDPLVSMITAVGTQQPKMTPTQIGNVLSKTLEMAKAKPEEMAQAIPALLASAKVGDLPIEVPLGMFAQVTRGAGGVATAATAGRSILLSLMKTPPEMVEKLAPYGFRKDMTLMQKIQWLADKGSDLPEELAAGLGGRRGIEAVATIATRPEEFRQGVAEIRQMKKQTTSELRRRLADLYSEDVAQRYLDQSQQLRMGTAMEDIQPGEMREQAIMDWRERRRRRIFKSPLLRGIERQIDLRSRDIFGEPSGMIGGDPFGTAVEALIDKGYSGADIEKYILPLMSRSTGLLEGPLPEGMGVEQYLESVLQKGGAGPMQAPAQPSGPAPGGESVSIGVQYNILDSTRSMLPGKQAWALGAVGGVA